LKFLRFVDIFLLSIPIPLAEDEKQPIHHGDFVGEHEMVLKNMLIYESTQKSP
jgi:hypothetical protein